MNQPFASDPNGCPSELLTSCIKIGEGLAPNRDLRPKKLIFVAYQSASRQAVKGEDMTTYFGRLKISETPREVRGVAAAIDTNWDGLARIKCRGVDPYNAADLQRNYDRRCG